MKKNLFSLWFAFIAILFSVNMDAQMTVGGKKAPEPFSALEVLNIGGVRMPQMTTEQRNAFAVRGDVKGEGLTIYNIDTKCIEYWNKTRWVSMCDGTSQATISPQPCINVAADGSGCDQTFTITDPDCPNGPFTINIVAGGEYAGLNDVDNANGNFKIAFVENNSVNTRTVLVRVTSTCTSLYKEFLFSQNGIDCASMPYTVPTVSPSSAALTLCTGGSVYLSVPANTANLHKLIWTRNGVEVARGVNYYIATQKGKYNISMGAIGCNTNAANERIVTESGTAAPVSITAIASNNGVICGNNDVKLSALGATGNVVWFHNGVQEKTGTTVTISGDSSVGEWFAAVNNGDCFSTPSNKIQVTKENTATGQVSLPAADVLVNGQPLSSFTAFCAGGTLDLSVANKAANVAYTWYNGIDVIKDNPFVVPDAQTKISLRLVASDNTGAKCPAEAAAIDKDIVKNATPEQPNITGNATLCDGTTDLTIVPRIAGTYTYTWYKNGEKMTNTTPTITVDTPGVTYTATITNATGCVSTLATKKIADAVSSLPVLSWASAPATATFGAKVTLQTAIEFGPATSYTWTADNGATVIGSGASVSIDLPASGTDGTVLKVTAKALNSCGNSIEIVHNITLNNFCPTPIVTPQTPLSQSVILGKTVTETVSVTTGVRPTYQWYSNTTASNTGGIPISGATTASIAYKPTSLGDSYVYCVVTNGCNGTPTAVSAVFTVTAQPDPSTLPLGPGLIKGRVCFDIAESNNYSSCGLLPGRQANKADFNLTPTNTQTYTFIPSGPTSKVRFVYVESLSGAIIKSITNNGDPSALNIASPVTATVVYQNSLSTSGGVQGAAFGLTDATALKVDIYVVYNNAANGSGSDVAVKLTALVKDCMCCGAMISATEWKSFMCHNVGVNPALDPSVPNAGLKGNQYYFGKGTVGAAADYRTTAWYNNGKTATDPCPVGYRIPTAAEWQGVLSSNALTVFATDVFNNGQGKYILNFGPALFIPTFTGTGSGSAWLWSSTLNTTYNKGIGLVLGNVNANAVSSSGVNYEPLGAPLGVRCISEN